jgi:hypothetical protein
MQARLGEDFAGVRIHTDARAAQSARAVAALAYTVGRHVVFDEGAYQPTSAEGRRTLAHELAHVAQQKRSGTAGAPGTLTVAPPNTPAEREAEAVAASSIGAVRVLQGAPSLQRLGANPGCTAAQATDIHQAIFNARGWLNKAIPQLEATPLSPAVLASLRRNFGNTYGVAANANMIAQRLRAAYRELSTIPIGCADAKDPQCAVAEPPCGYSAAGGHESTICTNPTLTTNDAVYRAGCVLHESLHAAFTRFTIDQYSGWHGHSGSSATYPGTGTEPLLNSDSYTSLVIDLS